jgi:phage terminase small subunit
MSRQKEKPKTLEELLQALTADQLLWIDAYFKLLNKYKASAYIGIPHAEARAHGNKMYRTAAVAEYICALMEDVVGDPAENIRLIQNIRDANISDYFIEVPRIKSNIINKPLGEIIDELKLQLDIENQYYLDYADTDMEIAQALRRINTLKRQICKLELQLKQNPAATRVMAGPDYVTTEMELDLAKVAQDKEFGKIKSFKQTKDGYQIELYSAMDAANSLARIQGSFAKDNEQLRPTIAEIHNHIVPPKDDL